MNHVVLLGDSILDNAAYTGGRPAVIDHLQDLLGIGWKASLLAVDGSVTALRIAFRVGIPLIDLRLVCTTPADYANEIEPSVAGGAKIAGAIVSAVTQHDFR
jgi:hypothetical protein